MQLFVGLEAVGEADDKGMRTVMTTLKRTVAPVFVREPLHRRRGASAEKADTSKPGQMAAPFTGVVTLKASPGDRVSAGQAVASIEAMKMEAAITAPVRRRWSSVSRSVPHNRSEAGDLLLVIRQAQ